MLKELKNLNTIGEVENYRKKINEECNSRIDYIKKVTKANELSNSSFGYIKECFESLSPSLFVSENGKNILKKYISLVNGNKNLSTMQTICEGIRKAGKNTDIDFFINKLSDKNLKINKSTISDDVKKLGMVLAEAYLILGDKADKLLPENNEKLNSAIDYIVENKYSLNNMSEYSNAIKIIRENIEKHDNVNDIFESKSLDEIANKYLEEFNKKYSEMLDEEQIKIFKEFASSDDKEEVFKKYKSLCKESLSKAHDDFEKKGDKDSSKRISTIIEQVDNKNYSIDTIGEDICNLIELSNIFD